MTLFDCIILRIVMLRIWLLPFKNLHLFSIVGHIIDDFLFIPILWLRINKIGIKSAVKSEFVLLLKSSLGKAINYSLNQ